MKTFVLCAAAALLGPTFVGCGSDAETTPGPTGTASSSSGTGGTGATGGGGGSGGSAAGGVGGTVGVTVAFQLLDDNPGIGAPTSDVPCVFDAPGGGRVEQKSDAEGRVTFTGVDWSLGRANLSCFWAWGAWSWAGFGEDLVEEAEDGVPRLWPFAKAAPPPPMVLVEGTVLSPLDAEDQFLVQTPVGFQQGLGTTYSITAPKDEPFDLLGLEFVPAINPAPHGFAQDMLRWSHVDVPAMSVDGTVDVDLSVALEIEEVSSTIALPASADSIFKKASSYGYAFVLQGPALPALYLGFPASSAFDAATTELSMVIGFVDSVVPAGEVFTQYLLYESNSELTGGSVLLRAGYPEAGPLGEAFLDAPRWAEFPSGPLAGAQFAWEPEGEAPREVIIASSTYSWGLSLRDPDATSVTIPTPPADVVLADLLGIDGYAHLYAAGPPLPDNPEYASAWAYSHLVNVNP